MKDTFTTVLILAALITLAALLPSLARGIARAFKRDSIAARMLSGTVACHALGAGTHADGLIPRLADAAITARHKLVKVGSDASHFALISAASDRPLGFCIDEPEAAEDEATIQLPGVTRGTVKGIAGEAVTADEDAYSKGDGNLMDQPTSAGTYWKVGRFLTAAASGEEVEIEPCFPQLVKVVANGSTLSQTRAAMTDGAIVIVLGA